MVEIRWSTDALDDLESITSYIEQDSPEKACDLVSAIFEKVEMLKDFPHLGRIFSERNDERIREIIYKNYRIVYEIKSNFIEILIVTHGSRIIRF
jgi:toxin ParE1/3/4